jgi:hypothetical protein
MMTLRDVLSEVGLQSNDSNHDQQHQNLDKQDIITKGFLSRDDAEVLISLYVPVLFVLLVILPYTLPNGS